MHKYEIIFIYIINYLILDCNMMFMKIANYFKSQNSVKTCLLGI